MYKLKQIVKSAWIKISRPYRKWKENKRLKKLMAAQRDNDPFIYK